MNKDRERNVFQDAWTPRSSRVQETLRKRTGGYEVALAGLSLRARGLSGPRSNHAPGRAGAIRGRAADWRGANGNSNSRPAAAKLDRDRRRH
jgi:hypothetical protein